MQSKTKPLIHFFILFGVCVSVGWANAQIVQRSANYPICVGAETTFEYTGTCSPIQWQFEGSTTVVSSDNRHVVVKWNSATAIAGVAVRCTSGVIPGPTFAVSANVIPTVSISGPTAICGGASVNFTSAPVNGGTSPYYTWMINGVAQPGQSGSTFNTNQLGLNNTVSVNMRSNHGCVAIENVYATSAPITIAQITSPSPVSVSITGKAAICPSEIPTYTANAINAGSSPVYRWYKDGVEVNDNELYQSPQYQYKPHYGLPNGGVITCTVTSSQSCTSGNPATSNVINVIVTNESPSLNLIIEKTTSCQGDPIKFTAISNFPITSYSWSIDNSVTLSNAAAFSPTELNTGNTVYLSATVSTACGTVSKYANNQSSPITVYPSLITSTSPGGSQKVCFGCSQLIMASQNENYTYQWRKDGSNIPSETGSTYLATEAGTYDVLISRSSCVVKPSNVLNLSKNIKPIANAGEDKTLAEGVTTVVINGSGTDSDGSIISYQWTEVSNHGLTIETPTQATLSLSGIPEPGVYVLRLTVTDDTGDTDSDEMTLAVALPPNNFSWVKETTVLVKDAKTLAEVDGLQISEGQKSIGWSYFDGLGRQLQSIGVKSSPSKQDMVQPISYNAVGKESFKYLPYTGGTDGTFKSDFKPQDHISYATSSSPQYFFYQNTFAVTPDEKPYAETKFESTPLNRVLKQGAPGIWQPNSIANSLEDKTMKQRYEINISTDVYLFNFDPATNAISVSSEVSEQHYAANALFARQSYDDKNHMVISFVDKNGRTVCKKVQSNEDNAHREFVSTYYIYDDLGNLLVVLPPEGVDKLKPILNLN